MHSIAISDAEFAKFQRFIFDAAGITLGTAKKPLVCGRLGKRLAQHQCKSYAEYFDFLKSGRAPGEVQIAIDLLTTNETYFFREPKHFDFLRELATRRTSTQPLRVWSAASSSGEEAYSIAMLLEECVPGAWEIMGSDISTRVLERARSGHYSLERAKNIPPAYLKRYCLRGTGPQEGTLLIQGALRKRVSFCQINLNEPLPSVGTFDVIFLRNVMIYFDHDTKRRVVQRLLGVLKPGGYLVIGHSESLHGIAEGLQAAMPSVYRKPEP